MWKVDLFTFYRHYDNRFIAILVKVLFACRSVCYTVFNIVISSTFSRFRTDSLFVHISCIWSWIFCSTLVLCLCFERQKFWLLPFGLAKVSVLVLRAVEDFFGFMFWVLCSVWRTTVSCGLQWSLPSTWTSKGQGKERKGIVASGACAASNTRWICICIAARKWWSANRQLQTVEAARRTT